MTHPTGLIDEKRNVKRGNFQQITKETNPPKLQHRRGWMIVTDKDCIGLYSSKIEAMEANLSDVIAYIPVVIDFYPGDGI